MDEMHGTQTISMFVWRLAVHLIIFPTRSHNIHSQVMWNMNAGTDGTESTNNEPTCIYCAACKRNCRIIANT